MAVSRTRPPRWFGPILLLGMLFAVAGLVGMGMLLYQPTDGHITIGDRKYEVPSAEVSMIRHEPSMFLRVRPSGKPFLLVHDQRSADARHPTGMPYIFAVNDGAGQDVVYGRRGRSIVACRRASSPAGGCGTWIEYGGTTWSVLFPEARAGEADKFVGEAIAALKRYDTSHRRLIL